MSEFENATPTSDKLRSFIENLQQPNARLRVSTPNNLGSEDDHYTSSDVFPLIVRAVNAFEPMKAALQNLLGTFNTPIMRRRLEGDEFALEAIVSAVEALALTEGGEQ
jgi:hypothetical protein